jgi:hypothetical protein
VGRAVLEGVDVAYGPEKRGESWVVLFTDNVSPKQRLDAPFRAAVRLVEPTLGRSLTLSLAGGVLLIAGGACCCWLGTRGLDKKLPQMKRDRRQRRLGL